MKAMKQELEWVRSNPKARQAKSKARLARYEEMSSVEYQKRNETQEIFIPVGERLGDKVIEFTDVTKGFGDKLLMDKVNFSIRRAPSSASSAPTAPVNRRCSR
jgi:sulfate-transporting ATPase